MQEQEEGKMINGKFRQLHNNNQPWKCYFGYINLGQKAELGNVLRFAVCCQLCSALPAGVLFEGAKVAEGLLQGWPGFSAHPRHSSQRKGHE